MSFIFYENWLARLEIFNLFNSKIDRIQYYYPTRLHNEPIGPVEGGYNDKLISPLPGRNFRMMISHSF